MELRRYFLIGVGSLVVFNLLLAFGSVGLLSRMSPAILEILEENVVSISAAETMLAVLATPKPESGVGSDGSTGFKSALTRARENVTEPDEIPVLNEIEANADAALAGNAASVSMVVSRLLLLSQINRQAMAQADAEAQRIGVAGAWVAVSLFIVSVVISLFVIRGLEKRFVDPLSELHDVLLAVQQGEQHRRCYAEDPPPQVKHVMDSVNALLSRVFDPTTDANPPQEQDDSALERAAIIHYLETISRAAVIVNKDGRLVATNQEALIVLSGTDRDAFLESVHQLVREGSAPKSIEAVRMGNDGWLCIRERMIRGSQSTAAVPQDTPGA
jgi:hypothetical protein